MTSLGDIDPLPAVRFGVIDGHRPPNISGWMLTRRTVTTAGYFIYSALQFITALRDSLLASGLDRLAVLASVAEVLSCKK